MKTNNANGKMYTIFTGAYIIVKSIINMIIGDDSVGNLIYSIFEALALLTGLMYINYVVAVIFCLVVLVNLKNNISNFSSNWFYLIEGVIDLGCAALLVIQKDIKEYFSNRWSDIPKKLGLK